MESENTPAGTAIAASEPHPGLSPRGVLAFIAAFAVPGAGHLLNGKIRRGILLGAVLIGIFVLGLVLGGRLDTIDVSNRLSFVFVFADAGSGLLYFGCLLAHIGIDAHAQNPTFEYGTALLRVAGLLNYLVALDAYDVAVGRKK